MGDADRLSGRRLGTSTIAIGVIGVAAASAAVAGAPAVAVVGVFALMGSHLTLGWKSLRLANRATVPKARVRVAA